MFLTNGLMFLTNGLIFLTNGWPSWSNGWMSSTNGWPSRSNGLMFLRTDNKAVRTSWCFRRTHDQAGRTDGCFYRTDDRGRSNRCKFFWTADKRLMNGKPFENGRFPVVGHNLRAHDCKYRESLARLKNSKILIICLEKPSREMYLKKKYFEVWKIKCFRGNGEKRKFGFLPN